MPTALHRLLQSYQFVERALDEHGSTLAGPDAERLRRDRDGIFLELLTHAAANPRIAQTQIEFFISSLSGLAREPRTGKLLAKFCREAVDRLVVLAEQTAGAQPQASPSRHRDSRSRRARALAPPRKDGRIDVPSMRLLDSLPDRAAIYSPDYRYIFTNAANAGFHGRLASEIAEMPIWKQIGEKCFAEVTKPNLDMVLAGAATSHTASLRLGAKAYLYAITYDPIRDVKGRVVSVLVVARDVTRFDVTPDLVWPAPDE